MAARDSRERTDATRRGRPNRGLIRGSVDFWLAYIQKTNDPPRIAGSRTLPRASMPSFPARSSTGLAWERVRSRGESGKAGCIESIEGCMPSATLFFPAMGG